jgi:methyltransferase (TIGR00027 family)
VGIHESAHGPHHAQVVEWVMLDDRPSLTAQGVALARSRLTRPASTTGDPGADDRLGASIIDERLAAEGRRSGDAAGDLFGYIAVRTAFFDDAVMDALARGVDQVVILGAGYDGRALRFRTPGVRFVEVDHPATQGDKRARLGAIDASVDDIVFVAADFTEPGLGDTLAAAGVGPDQRSLFLCEGVLRYLPELWFHELLRVAAERCGPQGELAVSISTRPPEADTPEAAERRRAHERALAESGEPVLTVPDRDTALRWLGDAGWTIDSVADVADTAPEVRPGRLLVRARTT